MGPGLKRRDVICMGRGPKRNDLFKNIWIWQLGLKRKEVICMGRGLNNKGRTMHGPCTEEERFILKHLDSPAWTEEERSDIGGVGQGSLL